VAKRYGLSVGINNYPGTDNDLSGCVNDAKDWQAELKERGFEAALLLDQSATKANIVREMRSLLEKAVSGDVVVFTYSGHGTWLPDDDGDEPDNRDEALCPYDVRTGVLIDDELYELFLEAARGVRVIFISDSCHSGSVARLAPASSDRKVRFMPLSAFLDDEPRLARARKVERTPARGRSRAGALLLSGCRDTEFSYDATFMGRPNGALTRVALDTLKTLDADATYQQWFTKIREKLPSMDYPQSPQLTATRTQKAWKIFV